MDNPARDMIEQHGPECGAGPSKEKTVLHITDKHIGKLSSTAAGRRTGLRTVYDIMDYFDAMIERLTVPDIKDQAKFWSGEE